jgi:hypothetical protein
VNPESYEAYLKGRYFWDKRTSAGFKKSIEYYQQAIAKDKHNALAYAGLAESYDYLRGIEEPPRIFTSGPRKQSAKLWNWIAGLARRT